jgi:hypothetical protein
MPATSRPNLADLHDQTSLCWIAATFINRTVFATMQDQELS